MHACACWYRPKAIAPLNGHLFMKTALGLPATERYLLCCIKYIYSFIFGQRTNCRFTGDFPHNLTVALPLSRHGLFNERIDAFRAFTSIHYAIGTASDSDLLT
jgi:hypothetical protein